jgi:hypothetical protein
VGDYKSGSAVPSPKTAKSVEIGFKHATVLSLGPQDQWVLEPASDKQIKIESLTGELKRGGKLSGKITGAIAGSKPAFSWDLQFDLVLPQRAAGPGLLTDAVADSRVAPARCALFEGNHAVRGWMQALRCHRTRLPTRVPAIAIGGRLPRAARSRSRA